MKKRRVAVGLLSIVLLLFAWLFFSLYRSIPPLSGRETLAGLSDSVTVSFDDHGIPRISAGSDADAMRALGYLHARDRLWSMDIMRRAAEGRLSEVLGGAALSADRFLRTLDVPGAARASLEIIPVETRALLDAYVAGVNQWISDPGRPFGPEFRVLRYRPEPWTALQSMMIARLMSWDLVTAGSEMRLLEARALVGPERAAELEPWYPVDGPVIVDDRGRMTDDRNGVSSVIRHPSSVIAFDPPPIAAAILGSASLRNSNSWVISGSRTASGKPILANDPHLGLRAPALWYLASISSPGLKVAGAGIPGLPGIIIGRNARIAWGLTNMSVDDVDYVIERLSPDSSQVMTTTGWQPVRVTRDSIRVRGRAAEPFTMRHTSHGPLVEGPPGYRAAQNEVHAVAMRWNGHDPSDELTAVLGVGRATSWTEFQAAVRGFKSPEQNWVYADVDGNIGYTASGNVPVRRSGQGLLPTNGWTDEGLWERYLTFEELPRAFNPPEGFIVTANNRVAGPGYPHLLGTGWELPYRAQRIRQMLETDTGLTVQRVAAQQMDVVDLFAVRFKELAAVAAEAENAPERAAALRSWDGTAAADLPEPLLFYAWYRALQRLTFEDEISGFRPTSAFHRMLHAGASPWFDDTRTRDMTEDLPALSRRAMREALRDVGARDGEWGESHQTISRHSLGAARPLDVVLRLNVGPFERPGSPFTVNVAGFGEWMPPFMNTHAASFRQVVDLSDSATTNVIITTGQSGNSLSRRYRDQAELWMRGELLSLSWHPRAEMRTLVLMK